MNWWDSHRKVVALARWLEDLGEWGDSPSVVIDFFEQPWKWTPEYHRMLAFEAGAPEDAA